MFFKLNFCLLLLLLGAVYIQGKFGFRRLRKPHDVGNDDRVGTYSLQNMR